MLTVIFSFLCFVVTIIGAYRVYKGVRDNDTENTNKWLMLTLTFMVLSWIVGWISSLFNSMANNSLEAKRKYFFLNEDYVFYEGITPRAYFKKGDLVSGIVAKADFNTGKLIGAAQSQAVQDDFLFIMSAKIAIPTNKLRYPNETELKEIEADIKKNLDK